MFVCVSQGRQLSQGGAVESPDRELLKQAEHCSCQSKWVTSQSRARWGIAVHLRMSQTNKKVARVVYCQTSIRYNVPDQFPVLGLLSPIWVSCQTKQFRFHKMYLKVPVLVGIKFRPRLTAKDRAKINCDTNNIDHLDTLGKVFLLLQHYFASNIFRPV